MYLTGRFEFSWLKNSAFQLVWRLTLPLSSNHFDGGRAKLINKYMICNTGKMWLEINAKSFNGNIVALSNLYSNIFCRIGRRLTTSVGLLVSGVFCGAVWFIPTGQLFNNDHCNFCPITLSCIYTFHVWDQENRLPLTSIKYLY